ncbi:MAG: LysM peptidoglycan-binding domain-containing protein [Eubacteriales bacterium]|nr:LysM peptidoglycan-binding domain-containing protein [Eubacteriales bacterium]
MKKRYVLKKQRRFYTIVSLFIVIGVVIIAASNVYSERPEAFETVNVKEGDTLWTIAESCESNMEIRRLVRKIKEVNNLEDSMIYVGTELKVPKD